MSQLSYESRRELARLRMQTTLNPDSFRFPVVKDSDREDGSPEWEQGISEPDDVGIQATPEVAQFGGITWNAAPTAKYDEPVWNMAKLVEYLAESIIGAKYVSPPAGQLPKAEIVEANDPAVKMREGMLDEEFRYVSTKTALYNGDLDSEVLKRWNQPDDVLEALDGADDAKFGFQFDQGQTFDWEGYMTAFREAQLRRLLRDYFDSDRYMDKEIVLKWKQDGGRWVPAEKMVVKDWVAKQIEDRGSRLSAYSACAGTLRSKMTRRRMANDKTGQSGGSWTKTYNAV